MSFHSRAAMVLLLTVCLMGLACSAVSLATQKHPRVLDHPRLLQCISDFSPFCICEEDSGLGPSISCDISSAQDFDEIRSALSRDSNTPIYSHLKMYFKSTIDIPQNVLAGKQAKYLHFTGPDRSTPLGQIHPEAFVSSSNYTMGIYINDFDLKKYRFNFLLQFPELYDLIITSCSLNEIFNMPLMPTLIYVSLTDTDDFETWYLPSQTPLLLDLTFQDMAYLDDQKMDSIMESLTSYMTYSILGNVYFEGLSLTRIPPLVFSPAIPGLAFLSLSRNPIVTLTAGSINTTNKIYLSLEETMLTTVEPGAFIGDFSSSSIMLGKNPMTTFPSSSFRALLRSMVNKRGYIDITSNPITFDCGLAWLLVDNRDLLPYVRNGAIANGTRFEDLDTNELINCY